MLDECERFLVLGFGVEQLVDAADRLHHARELAFAHLLFLKVDKLHLNTALLKKALGLLGIEGLFGAEDLDHLFRRSDERRSPRRCKAI